MTEKGATSSCIDEPQEFDGIYEWVSRLAAAESQRRRRARQRREDRLVDRLFEKRTGIPTLCSRLAGLDRLG